MKNSISSQELRDNLESLRKILNSFDLSEVGNIIFYDINSFYAFLKNEGEAPIEDIMDRVQPFIPIAVTEDNLELFLQASAAGNSEKMSELESKFKNKTRIDFINAVKNVETKIEWDNIVDICETIRDYKESYV